MSISPYKQTPGMFGGGSSGSAFQMPQAKVPMFGQQPKPAGGSGNALLDMLNKTGARPMQSGGGNSQMPSSAQPSGPMTSAMADIYSPGGTLTADQVRKLYGVGGPGYGIGSVTTNGIDPGVTNRLSFDDAMARGPGSTMMLNRPGNYNQQLTQNADGTFTLGDVRQYNDGGILSGMSDHLKTLGDNEKFLGFAGLAGGLGLASGLGAIGNGASQGSLLTPGSKAAASGWNPLTNAPLASSAASAASGGTGLAGGISNALSAIPGGAGTALMGASVLGDALSQSGPGAGPDFTSAATQQSQQQQAMNQDALNQNRYNEVTPYGSREWTRDANGNWTSTTSLSPEQQAIYDQENALSQQYGQTAQSLLSNAQGRLSNPFEFSGSDRQRVEDQIYGGMTSRLDDRFGRGEDQLRTRLTNQGITEGSEAWSNAMKDFNYGRNDAYLEALTASTGLGLNEANNEFNRQLTTYQQPLQSLSYLRSGNQAQVPQFGAGAQMQSAQAPNLMGAAQSQYGAQADQYNANAARRSNLFGGLFDIGSTLLRGK